MARRSIGTPLAIGIVGMVMLLALAVGWQVLVWTDLPRGEQPPWLDWLLLVLGTVFFVLVMIGLVWLCTWLVREMRLNQRQRAFLDAVTHEMRTPLASVRLHLDTLSRHDPDPETRREFIDHMRQDLDRLDHTIEQVLAAARAEEHGVRRSRREIDLGAVLRDCIADVRARHDLPESSVRLSERVSAAVRGDETELGLIFGNLLENAVKYSEDPVDVRVGVVPGPDGRVNVEIADSGIGIPPRELRRIFQRFYRAGREMQRTAAGLGLGLFVVRSLVRRQGGRVVARSEGAGRGSRFVVTLPATRAAA